MNTITPDTLLSLYHQKLISHKTLLNRLDIDIDAAKEIAAIKEERNIAQNPMGSIPSCRIEHARRNVEALTRLYTSLVKDNEAILESILKNVAVMNEVVNLK